MIKEILKEYKIAFEKDTNTKNRKKKKSYKELLDKEKLQIEKEEFIKYVKEKEKEKLLYFALANKQKNDVVIAKSPNKTDKIKKFLGYEWGSRKGSEGIQYLTSSKIDIDEEIDEEDKVVLENLTGLKHINTPLYNPQNKNDENKINKIIKDNFEDTSYDVPESLKEFVTRANLVDMIDFKRNDFNKAINLNPNRKIEIKSRWELVRLGDIVDVRDGTHESPEFYDKGYSLITSKNLINDEIDFKNIKYISKKDYDEINKRSKVDKGDILFAMIGTIGNPVIVNTDKEFAIKNVALFKQSKLLLNTVLKELLKSEMIVSQINQEKKGTNREYIALGKLRDLKIPLPPMDIQEKIVKECEAVDKKVESAKKENDKLKQEIENYFQEIYKKSNTTYKLNDENLFDVFIGKRVLAKDISQNSSDGIRVYSANVYEPFGYTKKEFLKDFSLDSVLWGIDGDWMVNHLKKDIPFYPTDHCGVIRVKEKNIIEPKYLAWSLREVGKEQRFSRSNRASTARIKALSIKAPKDYEFQKQIVSKIEELEKQIEKNDKIIKDSKEKKEGVLKKYL